MMINSKEVNKLFKEGMKKIKAAIDLAKKNMIVGEIRFPGKKVRKPKSSTTEPAPVVQEKPKRVKKHKKEKSNLGGEGSVI